MHVPRVILRTPSGGPWRVFTQPHTVLEARHPNDVRRCLADVDRAVRAGDDYAAGFVTYEAAAAFGLPVKELPASPLPLVWFGIFSKETVEDRSAIQRGGECRVGAWHPTIDHDHYLDAVRRIRSRIEAGDTYQINYTWRLVSSFDGDPQSLFVDLDSAQGGAWSAFVDLGRQAICSASPELFFRLEDGRIECRPMKGTAPRALAAAGDLLRGMSLGTSGKNRAENVMVVDMTRNDLGRIAQIGSVRVPALFEVERYPAQWQMVSAVTAEVPSVRLDEIFQALFPAASITGAPKHSSMEIIRGIESGPRGIYTGAVGWLARDRAQFNVAIRTVAVDRDSRTAEFGVGSGIVWDSVGRDEYEECLVKASILTRRQPAFELLESIGWTPADGFLRLDAHLARMRSSAEYFQFATFSESDLRASLERLVDGCQEPQKIRVVLARDGRLRCDRAALIARPAVARARLATTAIDVDDVFLYHKTTRRDVYERARRERPDADAVVLWNRDGDVTEAADANVVVEIDGRNVTPPIESGLLPGVERGHLLASAQIVERRVTVEDLRRATTFWLINSVRGWMRAHLDES